MSTEAKKSSLEDLMVAMDVVDTLRHRQILVDRELDAENRRERLIERLRDIYEAQGIEVTDQILAEGVEALEQERFTYQPPEDSFSLKLAKLYVSRDRWLKPLFIIVMIIVTILVGRYLLVTLPKIQELNAMPVKVGKTYSAIQKLTQEPSVISQSKRWVNLAAEAIDDENLDEARLALNELTAIKTTLNQSYIIRIVSRPGEFSGVWRIPDANSQARNYYLIVEAVDEKGQILSVPILSEENNKTTEVKQWGIRVDYSVFQKVAADKKDDGIIQRNRVGRKLPGNMSPEYIIDTTGAAITRW
jgi:hypothetical protein